MNGQINANFITTGLLSSNLVRTGILTSEDGSTWFNLDNGTFNFKNALKWYNNQLLINQGIVTIDKDKIRVNHGSTDEYSELGADGLKRQWRYGDSYYLSGAYAFDNLGG